MQLWFMPTDSQPHPQAAAISARLGGSVRLMIRAIAPQELMNGGIISGQQPDPVTYIVAGLQRSLARLDDASRQVANGS